MSSLDYKQVPIWRSFEELEQDPEYLERLKDEFPEHAEDLKDPLSRRRFMQLMGASMAMAGLVNSGCRRWEKDKIVPQDQRNGFIPGVPKRYTSVFDLGGVAAGLLVTAYDGRPIKIEGNPLHPYTGTPRPEGPRSDWAHGPTTAFAQASVLEVFDPDRSTGVRMRGTSKPQPFSVFKKFADKLFVPMQYLPQKWMREAEEKRKAAEEAAKKAAKEKAAKDKTAGKGGDTAKPEAVKPDAMAGSPAPVPKKQPVPPPPVANTKVRFLSEASSSPTFQRLRAAAVAAYPGSKWYEWEPLSRDNERLGTEMAFGKAMRPLVELKNADVIISLDADLFVNHPSALRNAAGFGHRRDPDEVEFKKGAISGQWKKQPVQMNRLYTIESKMSASGAIADHRLPLKPSMIIKLAGELRAAFDGTGSTSIPAAKKFVDSMMRDFKAARGAVIVAGYHLPPEVHAAVAYINAKKAATSGKNAAISYVADPDAGRKSHTEQLRELVNDINTGACETLIIIGGNPVYDSPEDLGFAAALAKADPKKGPLKTTIHLSTYDNETSAACQWHVNRAHYLEAWGDARTWDGTVTLAQPLIEPIHGGISAIDLLGMLVGEDKKTGRDQVYDTVKGLVGGKLSNRAWVTALHDGFVANTAYPPVSGLKPKVVPVKAPATSGGFELVFTPSMHTFDGRYANNAWLQETPEFLSKMTWDNVLYVGPSTAKAKGLKNRTWATVTVGKKSLKVGVYVIPGVAKDTVYIALGHGRTRAGHIGGHIEKKVKPAGTNTYVLRTSGGMYINPAQVTGHSSEFPLATTQGHWDVEPRGKKTIRERMGDLVKIGSVGAYNSSKLDGRRRLFEHSQEALKVGEELGDMLVEPTGSHDKDQIDKPLFQRPADYKTGPRWGMTTDLSKCIGCNACLLACQSENNIVVVGKEQVMRNREMNWIRIDTYFIGDDMDNPSVVHQPVNCQQCENAPCEQVCPVGATLHSDEGLNDMVYNRCVGTRYCMNNCPYKVRRFNFLDYNGRGPLSKNDERNSLRRLMLNPNVTVRARGVMEKCTYCIQRIQKARIHNKNETVRAIESAYDVYTDKAKDSKGKTEADRMRDKILEKPPVADGTVQTACQEVCPTRAITFGDLNDPTSKVYRKQYGEEKKPDPETGMPIIAERAYRMMPELFTQPRNLFLARVTNPNPSLKPSPARKHKAEAPKAKK